MNMLDLTRTELEKHKAFNNEINSNIQRIINAIVYPTVNPRMKAVIAIAQLSNFASQFRRNLLLWDDASIPLNAISFVITGSGDNKDSSIKAARKCFTSGFQMIENKRKSIATTKAIAAAKEAGEEPANEYDIYKAYLQPIPPIDIAPTTGPGLVQHINDIGELGISSGFVTSSEFSDELAYNQDMIENIKILSEIYDTGDKEVKYTKGIEHRSKAVVSQPVSALYVGSPGYILYDKATRAKFEVAFMSKLARRSWFCYIQKTIPNKIFDSVDEMLDYQESLEVEAKQARESMKEHINSITSHNLKKVRQDIGVPREVYRLFETYKRYNSDLANSLPNNNSTSALIRRHLQWKALKLAGALALFDKMDEVTVNHYVDAIRLCELLSQDMELFELDMNKSNHERFSDYLHTCIQADGKATISIHDIKKQGFIPSVSKTNLQELVTLCTAYDKSGVYSLANDATAIEYEAIIKTDTLTISYKPINITALTQALETKDKDKISNAKQNIAKTATYGFENGQTTFDNLAQLLTKSYAFTPFTLNNGIRGKDNIIGGTKWLVFDIDDSTLSAEEIHFLLSDLNHHIALGSDKTNNYKFHILLELDSVVTLDSTTWKHFYKSIADSLGLTIDPLPQSQIFFSYEDRLILSTLDGSTIAVREHIINAKEHTASIKPPTTYTSTQKTARLNDPLGTFSYAFECPIGGGGSRQLYRLIKEAIELGATLEQIHNLLDDVNNYWSSPMPEERLDKLKEQATRLF